MRNGHWWNNDPTGFHAGDANLARVVGNNPITNIDPLGLELVLVIAANENIDVGSPGITDGHSLLALLDTDTGTMTTYGLWPDYNETIQNAGLENGEGSDIRVNLAADNLNNFPYQHHVVITPKQAEKLESIVTKAQTWTTWNTCAGFASDTFYAVTDTDIDADDWLGYDTPREVGESIVTANGGKKTNGTIPVPIPAENDDTSSGNE